jgi:hypothetical protein
MNLLRKYNSMLWSKLKYTIFLFLVFSVVFTVSPVAAQEGDEEPSNPISISASAGYDSFYKGEFWVPVQINVSNAGTAVTGQLEIAIGGSTGRNNVIYSSPIDLPTQSNKRITTYVYLPNITTSLLITLVGDDGTEITEARTNTLDRMNNDDLLYGVVSTEANELAFLEDVKGARSSASVAFPATIELPGQRLAERPN